MTIDSRVNLPDTHFALAFFTTLRIGKNVCSLFKVIFCSLTVPYTSINYLARKEEIKLHFKATLNSP